MEANVTLTSGGVEDVGVIRRLVDVASDIEAEFARELAGILDDDEAKNAAQRQLELRALKQKIIDETSVNQSVSEALPKEYSRLGRMLLSSLQSGRIDSIRLPSTLKCVEALAQSNLSRSYMLLTWIVENAVARHARDERASMYLRPLFEGIIASGELTARVADQALTRDRQRRHNENVAQKPEAGELVTLDQLNAYLKRWLGTFGSTETITIIEPDFCPEDLGVLRLIRSVNPLSRITVVTRRSSQQISQDISLREVYLQYWKNFVSDQKPPNTRVILLDTSDGRSPFSETMILTQSAGIALSTNLRRFGVEQLGCLTPLEPDTAESVRESIQRFVDGDIDEFDGSPVEYSMWRL